MKQPLISRSTAHVIGEKRKASPRSLLLKLLFPKNFMCSSPRFFYLQPSSVEDDCHLIFIQMRLRTRCCSSDWVAVPWPWPHRSKPNWTFDDHRLHRDKSRRRFLHVRAIFQKYLASPLTVSTISIISCSLGAKLMSTSIILAAHINSRSQALLALVMCACCCAGLYAYGWGGLLLGSLPCYFGDSAAPQGYVSGGSATGGMIGCQGITSFSVFFGVMCASLKSCAHPLPI